MHDLYVPVCFDAQLLYLDLYALSYTWLEPVPVLMHGLCLYNCTCLNLYLVLMYMHKYKVQVQWFESVIVHCLYLYQYTGSVNVSLFFCTV